MRSAIVIAAVVLMSFTAAAAQQLPVQPGERVRVTVPSLGLDKHEERVSAQFGDTLVLTSTRCPIADIERLDVHAGRRSQATTGFHIGILMGALIGIPVAMMQPDYECDRRNAWLPCLPYKELLIPAFAVLGGVGGMLVGGLIETDVWREVPLDRLRVSVVPTWRGFGLAASIAF